jgi:hypothetical protein
MKKNPLALRCFALFCVATGALTACATVLDAVAMSCPAGAAAVAGLRAVVGNINSVINDPPASGSCGGPSITPGAGTSATQPKVQICAEGQECNTVAICDAIADDNACNTCAKGSCCAQVAAVSLDLGARCLIGCQLPSADGGPTPTLAECAALCGTGADVAYDALGACITDKCATDCKKDLEFQ